MVDPTCSHGKFLYEARIFRFYLPAEGSAWRGKIVDEICCQFFVRYAQAMRTIKKHCIPNVHTPGPFVATQLSWEADLSKYLVIFSILFFHFTLLAQNCRTYIDSGDTYYEKFNNSKAYDFYSKALKTCGRYEALYKTTRALNDLGQEKSGKEAVKFFQMALSYSDTLKKMFPDSVQSWFLDAAAAGNLADYKHGGTQIELARRVYESTRKAIDIDSSFAPARVIIGTYYREVALAGSLKMTLAKAMYGGIPGGTLKDSKRELEKAVELDSQNIFAHFELAKTYHALKDNQNATKQLNIVLSLPDLISETRKVKKEAKQLMKSWGGKNRQ